MCEGSSERDGEGRGGSPPGTAVATKRLHREATPRSE